MISQDLKTLSARFAKVSRIIWFAFLGGPVVYGVLAWVLTQGGSRRFPSNFPDEAIYLLVLIAFVSGPVLGWVIMPRLTSPQKLLAQGQVQPVGNFGQDQARYARLSDSEKKKAEMFGAIQASFITRWACAESVGVYGMMGLMVGVLPMYGAWAFAGASILLLTLIKPDYEAELEKLRI